MINDEMFNINESWCEWRMGFKTIKLSPKISHEGSSVKCNSTLFVSKRTCHRCYITMDRIDSENWTQQLVTTPDLGKCVSNLVLFLI